MFPIYNKNTSVFGSACSDTVQSVLKIVYCVIYSGNQESETRESASVLLIFLITNFLFSITISMKGWSEKVKLIL